ncbi:uncharacterized protein PG998_010501 [Apiospora kogelbergensis]|uniref:uncharacterized protein n=1 Tax=Apiospora kogelbergensis TaxID=1337665 RepID=UPI00313160CD
MSSTAAAAASTLTRPRIAITIVSAVAAVSISGYCIYQPPSLPQRAQPACTAAMPFVETVAPPLRPDDSSESDGQPQGDENADTNNHTLPLLGPLNDDDWYSDPSSAPRQRTGENIVTLLFRVSEDNARRNAYVHRGCQCNGCGMVPIRGIRYRCANCTDFDLCEVCESQGLHIKTHVFYKIQPAWYPGDPDSALRSLPRHLLAKWANETGFERVELDAFWEQWTFIANTEWRDDPTGLCLAMDRKTFERCLVPSGGYQHTTPNLIHDRMFAFYDTNKDDLIGFEEFLHGVSYRKRKDKLKRTFEGYDIDGDGFVSRKDFLRMFRAYYVLYKQMHRDILEGLDDHMMASTEVQQLVSSRAPLSSLFGREGRVPPADHSRPMEGKVFSSNGEVNIHDGKFGVTNRDKPDTSSREDILSGLFARNTNQSFFTESFSSSSRHPRSSNADSRYLSGITSPPQNIVDLESLVNGDYSQLNDIIASIRSDDVSHRPAMDDTGSASSDDQDHSSHDGDADPLEPEIRFGDSRGSIRYINGTTTRRTATITRVPHPNGPANSQRLGNERRRRVQTRRQILDRWKRRQFYLDVEEGALPPQGWDENEDILESLNGVAESSKSAQPAPSPRSRSSSKVRFAEDTDDFDIRSNPSTSSRSVPERWGGMEIPDAERDAAKEILYQVTQQAFNELLDDIFKKAEDLAIRCAETRAERNKYRHLFESLEVDSVTTPPDDEAVSGPIVRPAPQQETLEELLEVSGYSVEPAPEHNESPQPEPEEENPSNGADDAHVSTEHQSDPTPTQATFAQPTGTGMVSYRDPTMPQFRPNDAAELLLQQEASHGEATNEPNQTSSNEYKNTQQAWAEEDEEEENDKSNNNTASSSNSNNAGKQPEQPITDAMLETWKRLDLAEEEAKRRGGWGKLSFREFEDIYREHEFQDSTRNRLDYLGSWIDFCIP